VKPVDEELELARLLASEPAALSVAVATLRERVPDAAELASLASRLALQGIDVGPRASSASSAIWKKWALAAGGVSTVIIALAALRASQPANTLEATSSHAAATEPIEPPEPRPTSVPVAGLRAPSPISTPSVTVSGGLTAARRAQPGALPPAPSNAATTLATPGASTTPRSNQPAGSGEPSSEPSRRNAANPRAEAEPPAGAADSAGAATAPTEIELLRDARLALRQSPARALTIAEEHAQLYPRGKLSQERELIAISALVALGRRTAALSRSAAFERAFPASPYRKQLNELLR
jgi:hypothetical protein